MAAVQPIYRVDERVDGLYDENADDMWYPGRIRSVHLNEGEDATFEVLYDDGEVETNVRPEFLRQHVSGTICVGTRVLCRYDGGDEFYPGQVSDVQENGKYTIAYDDGEVEEDVPIDHVTEPTEDEEEKATEETEEADMPSETLDDSPPEQPQEEELDEAEDLSSNQVDDADGLPQETVDRDSRPDEVVTNEPLQNAQSRKAKHPDYDKLSQPTHLMEDLPDPTPAGQSAERAYIAESLQQLEKRLGDAASTKSVLSTLVKQMRAYPQVTANLVHEHGGERLVIGALKFHQSHAVIQCYGFVLLRRLCFLCVKSTHYLLRNGIVELVMQAMSAFAEDAILQASACGALAVFTRVNAGLNTLIEFQVAQLVLSTLIYHKTYSVHTRQVHYYACEVLLELCELDDLQTLNLLCGEQEEDFTGDMSPISLLLFLLRQGLSLDDKKACCAVGSLLMCLAASGRRAAALILSLNGLPELSTVMARYPTEPSIQKYSATASRQIALCSVRQSPTKRIKDTATEILREAESLENTPKDKLPTKRGTPRRATGTGKRKKNPTTGYGASSYPRGTAHSSSRNTQAFSKMASPYEQTPYGFGNDMNSFGYPATAPQQPSSLVILDGGLGLDSGFGSTNKRKQLSKEERQSELFDAYGIHGIPNSNNGRPYGTKRAQLKAHLASAEIAWAAPQQYGSKPYSSHSDHQDAYSNRDFMPTGQNRWDYDIGEPQNPAYDPELRQPRGAKRKKKSSGGRTAFQVRVENENQLRVSREAHSPYPSPQRLGVATKRAAKARQKRMAGGGHSSLTGRSGNASSESLNEYATQLFQDNVSRGTGVPSSSRLTPREKEEIRERERLSFAEKLHKMIDKAKSTLANGNTTSVPAVDNTARTQKATTASKTARRLSATFSDDKHPQSKKPRAAASNNSKPVAKDVLSPRETVETRPAKLASGVQKRQAESVGQQTPSAPVVPRAKPTVSRSAVAPKATSDLKPRKSSKTAPIKDADKHAAEKAKTSVAETTPTDIALVSSTPEANVPNQVEAVEVASEPVVSSTKPTEEPILPAETKPMGEADPTVPNNDEVTKVESDTVPMGVAIESKEEDTAANNDNEENTVNLLDNDASVEAPVDVPSATDAVQEPTTDIAAEAAPELLDPPADVPQTSGSTLDEPGATSELTDDQPSGGSAAVDAMYGDAYNEFDDNIGDDEDMGVEADTDETQTPVTETSGPPTDVPLQESKSGEALYDDGYDEFDEDEEPNTEDTEAEAADDQASDVVASQPTEIESDPAANTEVDGDLLADKIAVVEEPISAPTEGGGEGNSNVNEKDGKVAVDLPGSKSAFNETKAAEMPQADVINVDDAESSGGSLDPAASNEEQDERKLTTDLVAEPCGEGEVQDDARVDPVSSTVEENTGVDAPSANGEGLPDEKGIEDDVEHEAESGVNADDDTAIMETTETIPAEENAQPGPLPLEDEAPVTNPPNEAVDIIDPDSEVPLAVSARVQQDKPSEAAEGNAQPDESLTTNESPSLLDQDEDSKKLSADNSNLTIQSATYDEENFDEEETHPEVELSETAEIDPGTAAVVGQLEQEDEVSAPIEAPVEADTPSEVATTAEQDGEDSKTLVANSSEQSVQSAAYEDEDFDDAAQEESKFEKILDDSEDKAPEKEPSLDEVAENELHEPTVPVDNPSAVPESGEPKDLAVDTEDPNAEPDTYGDEDFDNTAQAEAASQNNATAETLPETTEEPPEQQQVECSSPIPTADPGVAAADPAVTAAESEPDTTTQKETIEGAQEPAIDEADKFDSTQVEEVDAVANVDDGIAAAAASEDLVESSDPPPVAAESEVKDVTDSEPPEITLSTEADRAEEETLEDPNISAEPEAYNDEDFDNGAEEDKAPPNATTQNSGSVDVEHIADSSRTKELDIESSEQPSANIEEPGAAGIDSKGDINAKEETSPDSELPTTALPGQLDEIVQSPTAIEPGVAHDADDQTVPEVMTEPETVLVDPVADQVESQPTEDGTKDTSAADELGSSVSEVTTPEPESQAITPDNQPNAEDKPDVASVPNAVADTNVTEGVPEPGIPSDKLVEPENNEATTIAPSKDQSADTTETPDYTQGDDEFNEDSPEPDPTLVTADNSSETVVDTTQDEGQYGDADFDAVENDTANLKDVAPENDLAKSKPDANEITAQSTNTGSDGTLPAKIPQTEEKEDVVNDDKEVLANTTKEEAASLPVEIQAQEDVHEDEAVAGSSGDVSVVIDEQPVHDTAAEPGDQGDTNTTEAEVEEPPTAYEEGIPSESTPETHEDVVMAPSADPTESEDAAIDLVVADGETPAKESSANAETAEDVPQDTATIPYPSSHDEQYDDGFEDDTPVTDKSDSGATVDNISVAEADPVLNVPNGIPDSSTTAEAPEDNVVAKSEQPHEDQTTSDKIYPNGTESAEIESEVRSEDDVHAAEMEPTETHVETEPVGSATLELESARNEAVMNEPVESEPEPVKTEALEPDGVEPGAAKSEIGHSDAIESETGEAVVSSEPGESIATELDNKEHQAVDPVNEDLEVAEPVVAEPEGVEPEAVKSEDVAEPNVVEPEAVVEPEVGALEAGDAGEAEEGSTATEDSAPIPKTEPMVEELTVPESSEEDRPSKQVDATESVGDLPPTEVPIEVFVDTPVVANDNSSLEEKVHGSETKEDAIQAEEIPTDEPAASEEPVENSVNASVDATVVETPAEAAADEPKEPVQPEVGSTIEADPLSSDSAQPVEETAGGAINSPDSLSPEHTSEETTEDTPALVTENTPELATDSVAEVKDKPVDTSSDAPAQEPAVSATKESQPSGEEQASVEPDYSDDPATDEAPVVVQVKATPSDEVAQEEEYTFEDSAEAITDTPRQEPTVSGNVDVPKAPEEMATDVAPTEPDEVAADTAPVTPPIASEAPKDDDQYDDDEGYNDFEDHDNAPVSPPTVGVTAPTAPVATEAPATEDEYEEYNDDYGEEEKPSETPRADSVAPSISTPSEPPASAREEEIEEVADEPAETAEEAYADDQDEYNNEYEEDDKPAPAPTSKIPPPKKEASTTQPEASGDEYEDDNEAEEEEEDYAEDEIEDSTPAPATKAAPPQPAADDEMEEEVGYESEEYADSDG